MRKSFDGKRWTFSFGKHCFSDGAGFHTPLFVFKLRRGHWRNSKGTLEKLLPQAKKAIIYGSIGIIIGYGVFIYDMHTVLTDPQSRAQLNEISKQMNGVSFDEMLQELGVQLDD